MTGRPKQPESSLGYEVGYGRPPAATRFKPGQSGNPKGRPKGLKGPKELLTKILAARVKVHDQGRERSMTAMEVVLRNVVNSAMARDPKSVNTLFGLLQRYVEPDNASTGSPAPATEFSEADAAILQAFLAEHGIALERADDGLEERAG